MWDLPALVELALDPTAIGGVEPAPIRRDALGERSLCVRWRLGVRWLGTLWLRSRSVRGPPRRVRMAVSCCRRMRSGVGSASRTEVRPRIVED